MNQCKPKLTTIICISASNYLMKSIALGLPKYLLTLMKTNRYFHKNEGLFFSKTCLSSKRGLFLFIIIEVSSVLPFNYLILE